MLYSLKSYLKFLLASTNEHGVHSPFVYGLLTKCIYQKQHLEKQLPTLLAEQSPQSTKDFRFKKKQIIHYKIASYFKSNEILILDKSILTKNLISLARPNSCITQTNDFIKKQVAEKKFDLVVINTTNNTQHIGELFEKILESAHQNCVFIFEGIYTTKATTKAWQAIVASQKTTVSIDGFYLGLVFLKKDQEKQHFTLRM